MNLLQQIFSDPNLCNNVKPVYLFFSENVPSLIYYSHLPIALLSILLGIFVLSKNTKSLSNILLFALTLSFSIWVFLDSIFWAANRSDVIMFVWLLQILFEPLVYISSLYLVMVVITGKDISFRKKLIIFFAFLPVIILLPTKYTLSGFDLNSCLSNEGFMAIYYTYIIEILCTLWIIVYSIKKYIEEKDKELKDKIFFLTVGVVLLLIAFSMGNIISSFSEDWTYAQIGLFMMPIFISYLAYTIIKFKVFNFKLLTTESFVFALGALLAGLLFIQDVSIIRIIVSITLIIYLLLAIFLVKSVKRVDTQRDQIQKQAKDLEQANIRLTELDQQKTEFISLATHQLRGPLGAIKGYASLLLEGDFGEISERVRKAVKTIFQSTESMVVLVNDYLDVSRIEQGKMKYDFTTFNLKDLLDTAIQEIRPMVEAAHLNISFRCDDKVDYRVHADMGKLKQVILNILDNGVKYTHEGGIMVTLTRKTNDRKLIISIVDTGVGIPEEVIPHLFEKFSRAPDASKVNILGTGLGLYVAKKFIEAHQGHIWVNSQGKGKGSQFYIELWSA